MAIYAIPIDIDTPSWKQLILLFSGGARQSAPHRTLPWFAKSNCLSPPCFGVYTHPCLQDSGTVTNQGPLPLLFGDWLYQEWWRIWWKWIYQWCAHGMNWKLDILLDNHKLFTMEFFSTQFSCKLALLANNWNLLNLLSVVFKTRHFEHNSPIWKNIHPRSYDTISFLLENTSQSILAHRGRKTVNLLRV